MQEIIKRNFVTQTIYYSSDNIDIILDYNKLHVFGYYIIRNLKNSTYEIKFSDKPIMLSETVAIVVAGPLPIAVLHLFDNPLLERNNSLQNVARSWSRTRIRNKIHSS